MRNENFVLQAGKSLFSAAELFNQVAAVHSFTEQGLIERENALDEIDRLIRAMQKEARNACQLLDRVLERGIKA